MLTYVWFALNVAVALVNAVPIQDTQTLTVQEAQNKTLCPFVVVPDIEEGRVPWRINHVKCLTADTAHWCSVNKVPRYQCCDHEEGAHRTHCVQLVDVMPVTVGGVADEVVVSVGCACTPRHVSYAISPEP